MSCNVAYPMHPPAVEFHTPHIPDGKGRYEVEWPDYWPIPRIGDTVVSYEGVGLIVKSVTWHPRSDGAEIYIVLTLPRKIKGATV